MTTLQTLITRVRQRTMMENDQSVTDAEITDYLNSSLAFLDSILKQNDDYAITKTSFTITNVSTPYFAVPSDFFKLRLLRIQVPGSPNLYITMRHFSMREMDFYNNFTVFTPFDLSANICYLSYRPMLPNIYIEPEWAPLGTYQLWYTPVYIPLVNTSDNLQAYMDTQAWNEYSVCDVCGKVNEKLMRDGQPFNQRAMIARQQIEADSSVIDRGSVRTIADDRDDFDYQGW